VPRVSCRGFRADVFENFGGNVIFIYIFLIYLRVFSFFSVLFPSFFCFFRRVFWGGAVAPFPSFFLSIRFGPRLPTMSTYSQDYQSSSTPSVASSVFDDSDDDGECKICGKNTPALSGLCRGCECKVARHAPRSAGYARILKNAALRRSRMKYKRDRVRASLDQAAADTDFMLLTRNVRRNEQDVDEFDGLDDEERDLVGFYSYRQGEKSHRQRQPAQGPHARHPPNYDPLFEKQQELARREAALAQREREAELAQRERALVPYHEVRSSAPSSSADGSITPSSPVSAMTQSLSTLNLGENTTENFDGLGLVNFE
jgi:hypothetical protein